MAVAVTKDVTHYGSLTSSRSGTIAAAVSSASSTPAIRDDTTRSAIALRAVTSNPWIFMAERSASDLPASSAKPSSEAAKQTPTAASRRSRSRVASRRASRKYSSPLSSRLSMTADCPARMSSRGATSIARCISGKHLGLCITSLTERDLRLSRIQRYVLEMVLASEVEPVEERLRLLPSANRSSSAASTKGTRSSGTECSAIT